LDVIGWRKKPGFNTTTLIQLPLMLDEAILPGGKKPPTCQAACAAGGGEGNYLKGFSFPSQNTLILFLNAFLRD